VNIVEAIAAAVVDWLAPIGVVFETALPLAAKQKRINRIDLQTSERATHDQW
jgi:hypothetical protein